MNNSGRIIAELRREAGYTQRSLAEVLNITDKAISKWERGLSLPDVSLLPKLSALLDADIELLIQESASGFNAEWAGLVDLRNFSFRMDQMLYDKPMVYYILSHFLLVGIKNIYFLGDLDDQDWINWEIFNEIDVKIIVNPEEFPKKNLMIMQKPCFLFGSDLTRRYQAAMSMGKVTKVCPEWDIVPFLFCPLEYSFFYNKNPEYLNEIAVVKKLGRGMVCFSIETVDQINDISSFVRVYQNSTGLKLNDIYEIAKRKDKNIPDV